MRNHIREKDEHLERLWYMKEKGQDSMGFLESSMEGDYDAAIVSALSADGLVEVTEGNGSIRLSPKGEEKARRIVRAHRLGERLLYDVFGGEFETGACEFEHIVTEEIVDGICVLLGHPRECPHGLPIPEGECCRRSARVVSNLIIPLTELEVGKSAKIAYINYGEEQQMQRIDGLQIRPGSVIRIRQTQPCTVIECEGAHVAMDPDIASCIRVWSNGYPCGPVEHETSKEESPCGNGWARLLRFGRGKS